MARKSAAKLAMEARIQRAVNRFQIPMLSMPALSKALEAAIAEGKSDDELRDVVAGFPGVNPSS